MDEKGRLGGSVSRSCAAGSHDAEGVASKPRLCRPQASLGASLGAGGMARHHLQHPLSDNRICNGCGVGRRRRQHRVKGHHGGGSECFLLAQGLYRPREGRRVAAGCKQQA